MPTPTDLLSTFLDTIVTDIQPLTEGAVSTGSKVFGAAIFTKEKLDKIMVATNNETASPLLHGEINCLVEFYKLPPATRPSTKDCIFFATHEPCSLCLSGITWSGFDNFYYLFSYEDTRDAFSIPYDIDIIESVFKLRGDGESDESYKNRPLYAKDNKFFRARSVADLLEELEEGEVKEKLREKVIGIKHLYGKLSATYQAGKGSAGIPLA